MNNLKGVGWKELIKSPEYYAKQSRETLSPIISRLSAVANKRLKRMEQQGIEYSGYSGEKAIAGVKKFEARGKTLGQLRAEYKRLQGFLESPISTLTGRKEQYYQAKKRFWERASPKEREIIGEKPTRKESYKEYTESKKSRKDQQKEDFVDETEIFDDVSRIFQVMRDEHWLAQSETLRKMRPSDQIRAYFEEQVIRSNIFGTDVLKDIRKDLGIDIYEEEESKPDNVSTSQFF